jgi:hypothetical protein
MMSVQDRPAAGNGKHPGVGIVKAATRKITQAVALTVLLGACGGAPESGGEATELRDAVQAPQDRARAVEDVTAARKAELDEQLDAAGSE